MCRQFSKKILISTNSSCNLKCIYCFEKHKGNNEFDVMEAVSVIGEMLTTKSEYGTKIKIHGGEPFLVFDKTKQLYEGLCRMNYPEYFEFHITTNATLIHREIKDWLYKHKERIRLKLSVDGDKLSSDINRPDSFEKIDFSFLLETWPELVASMTITPQTLPLFCDNIKFMHSIGFKNIIFQLSLMTEWQKYHLQKEYYHQLSLLVQYYLENKHIAPCFHWLDIGKLLDNPKPLCGVGRMKAYDFQTKSYYPCQMCFPSACGDKTSKELQEYNFTSADILAEGECASCPFVNLCITCYAENYITRGSAARRDMNICSYQKILFFAIFQYEYMRIIQKETPTGKDVKQMKAIQRFHESIAEFVNNIY